MTDKPQSAKQRTLDQIVVQVQPAVFVNRVIAALTVDALRLHFFDQDGDVIYPRAGVAMTRTDAEQLCQLLNKLFNESST